MKELMVVAKDKKGQKFLSLINQGETENRALSMINEPLDKYTQVGLFLGLIVSMISGGVTCISTNHGWGILIMGVSFISSFFLIFFINEKLSYQTTKFLATLSNEEKVEVEKLLSTNSKKDKLMDQYKADPDLFIFSNFGSCSYDLSLRFKLEMQKKEGFDQFIFEVADKESATHKELLGYLPITNKKV